MTTQIKTPYYHFSQVDFDPSRRSLVWHNKEITHLSYEESILLETLCYHAGQVLSSSALYRSTAPPDTSFIEHQNNLNSLLEKSSHQGKKKLPLHKIQDHGYRIDLPKYKTQALTFIAEDKKQSATLLDEQSHFITKKYLNRLILLIFMLSFCTLLLLLFFHY